MSRVDTVWDYDPDLEVKPIDQVSGKMADGREPPGGFNLGVFGELAIHLKTLVGKMDEEQKRRERQALRIPFDYTVSAAGVYPSSGTLLLNLGSADVGQQWELRRLVIGGADISTAPAGTGWLFVTGSPPNQSGASGPTSQLVDFTSGSLPQKAFYGTHEVVINESEYLYVIITGGTAGTEYVASGKVEGYDLSERYEYIY